MTWGCTARGQALLVDASVHATVTLGVLLAIASLLFAWLDLSALYAVKAACLFAGGVLLSAPLLRRSHPFALLGSANRITLLRAMLVALLGGFLGEATTVASASIIVVIGLVALILDGVDGHLARRQRNASEFGARFDMETDAALILAFSLLAWHMGKAGAWVVLSGLLRYLFVAAGWLVAWMRAPLEPSKRRQTVCVIQVAVLLVVLLPFVRPPWSEWLAAVALAVLAASFLMDVRWLAIRRSNPSPVTPVGGNSP